MRLALIIITLTAFAQVATAAPPNPALAPGATLPPGAVMPPPQPAQIDRNTVLVLIRTTLVALQQANQTGNYSVLQAISAPGFQKVNSPEKLAEIFANLRAKNFDLSGVVVLDPQLSVMPEQYQNGVLRMAGFFPSVPIQVYFDLQFIPVQGQWKLLAISVNVAPPIGSAPNTPPANQSPQPAPSRSAQPKNSPDVGVDIGKPKQSATASPRK